MLICLFFFILLHMHCAIRRNNLLKMERRPWSAACPVVVAWSSCAGPMSRPLETVR